MTEVYPWYLMEDLSHTINGYRFRQSTECLVRRKLMSFKINGWSEGHPHLTRIDSYPFGALRPKSRNPLGDTTRDGYASSFRQLYKSYKRRANKFGREFTLTEQDFYLLTSQPCFYCATPPAHRASKRGKISYVYNGLDRRDRQKGYIPSNCVACCWKHNDLKGRLSFQEFYQHSLAVVLSVSSRTAVDIGDLTCLELLIELFPNVRFLNEHRTVVLEDMRQNPRKPRFNWRLEPVQPRSK